MIALILFSGIAALIVWLAGRRDAALDPRLTTLVIGLLLAFPLLILAMPNFVGLPSLGEPARAVSFPWLAALSGVWLAGCMASFIRLTMTVRGISQWTRGSVKVGEMDGIEIRKLEGLRGPVAAGVFRKVVLVPGDWESWPEDRRSIVMKHELAHHRRKDPLRRWLAELAVAVHWFNPFVRWMVKRLMIQCEYACDIAVLKEGVPAKNYATLLCDLAEERSFRGPVLAMAEKSGLESRVERMMAVRGEAGEIGLRLLLVVAVLLALLLALMGARQSFGFSRPEIETRRSADPFPGN